MTADLAMIENRIRRAQAELAERDIDFLFVTPSSDLTYLLNYPAHPSERMTLLAIPRSGKPTVIVPTLEATRLADRDDLINLRPWDETENPAELAAEVIPDLDGATIAVGDRTWAVFLIRLMQVIEGATFVEGDPLVRELRMTKDSQEIRALRHVGAETDKVWEKFVSQARLAGRTELDVAHEIMDLITQQGLDLKTTPIVGSGPASASPHHITGERVIQPGDAVVIDFGATWHHYVSDITRTLHVGEPSDEYRRVYQVVLDAQQAAFEAIRPGVPCQDVDRAARRVIEQAGYGEYFIHRVGHGIGIDGHEEPYLVEGNTLPLRPGMVMSDEPGIYIPARFGVRIEDTVLCTDTGAERLNNTSRDLTVVE